MFIEKSSYLQSELIPPSYLDDKNQDDFNQFWRVFWHVRVQKSISEQPSQL